MKCKNEHKMRSKTCKSKVHMIIYKIAHPWDQAMIPHIIAWDHLWTFIPLGSQIRRMVRAMDPLSTCIIKMGNLESVLVGCSVKIPTRTI